jgi:hypothetical protein
MFNVYKWMFQKFRKNTLKNYFEISLRAKLEIQKCKRNRGREGEKNLKYE